MPAQPSSPPPAPAAAAKPGSAFDRVTGSLSAMDAKKFDVDAARHLLNRAGFGGSPQQIQTLVGWGLAKSVDYLVGFDKVKDEAVSDDLFDRNIIRPPTDEERAEARRAQAARDEDKLAELRTRRQQAEREDREQMRKLQQWWLTKMVETSRPLQEKMTLFWHGILPTSYRTIEDSYHMFAQNQLYRRHATGSYAALLHGLVQDPAMIAYLDNNASRKGKPNENLARELMELFSLGVGNYTEADIKEGARALTGYTYRDDEFYFEKNNHDGGGKTILGRTGNWQGKDFVDILLAQPACAKYVCRRLYQFFVHDYPTGNARFDGRAKAVIDDLAVTFRSRYDVGATLRRLFMSEHFFDAAFRNEQIKSPVQLVVGAIRSLNAPARDVGVLNDAAGRMGQSLFFPPSVKGWDGGRAWINTSTMFERQNTAVFLLTGRRLQGRDGLADKEKFSGASLLAQLADAYAGSGVTVGKDGDPRATLDAILRFTIGRTDPAARAVLDEFVAARKGQFTDEMMTELMLLITALPEYQLC